jgi:hypothetical protein
MITIDAAKALAIAKARKIAEINAMASGLAGQLTAGYPDFEKTTWPDQQAEALAWAADHDVLTPYIDALALERGIARELYLQKTVQKVQLYRGAAQKLVGQRQKYVDQVNAAQTPEAVYSVVAAFSLE